MKDVLPFSHPFSLMIPLRAERDALQSHFTHRLCGILGRNANSLFGQNCGDLFRAKPLMAFIKSSSDVFLHFSFAFVISSYFFPSGDMVIEGPARDAQSFTERVNASLAIQFGKFLQFFLNGEDTVQPTFCRISNFCCNF